MQAIYDDITYIERFDLTNSPFEDYDFFPMGIPNYDDYSKCLEQNILNHASEMLIISPFVDMDVFNKMVNCASSAKKTLITRHSSVTQDMIGMFNDGVYVPKEVLTDKVEKDVAVDLHEKVYFVCRNEGNLSYNHLYLGSTNATKNGFRRNVEFLLHLQFEPSKSSYDKFRSELINDSKECMFEKVVSIPSDEMPKEDVTNELMLRTAIAALQKAKISGDADNYTITIQCQQNKLPKKVVILYPLGCDERKKKQHWLME